MKVLVAGGRDFDSTELANRVLTSLIQQYKVSEIISGTARGADTIGEVFAYIHNIPVKRFEPDWEELGKKAGFIRNVEMGKYCDIGIIFWDGKSKGTKSMIDLLERFGKKYKIIKY